jgi:hypothetical protein
MLTFTISGSNLQIGNSYSIKDHLKNNLKAKWNPEARAWEVPTNIDCDYLRNELTTMAKNMAKAEREKKKEAAKEAAARETERRIYLATPEGKEAARQQRISENTARKEEDKQRMARGEEPIYWWIHCIECEVVDWYRKHTSCDACADDHGFFKNTFRVRGCRYTGD